MMNVSLLFVQTHPSGICLQALLDVGGVILTFSLLSVIPHSSYEWKNSAVFLLLGFQMLSHVINLSDGCRTFVVHWLGQSNRSSPTGLDSEPNRPVSQFGQATLQTVPTYSIKTFIWKKCFTETERKGREIPWSSRPLSSPCSGKAIREQLSAQTNWRNWELEDEWEVSKLCNYPFYSYAKR